MKRLPKAIALSCRTNGLKFNPIYTSDLETNNIGSSMKLHRIIAALAASLLVASSVSAQNMTTFRGKPGSNVKIDGSGNVHDWTVDRKSTRLNSSHRT